MPRRRGGGGRRGTGHGSHVANSRDQKAPYTHTHANSNGELTMNGKWENPTPKPAGRALVRGNPVRRGRNRDGDPLPGVGMPRGQEDGEAVKKLEPSKGMRWPRAVGVMGGGLLHDPLPPENLVEGTRPQQGAISQLQNSPPRAPRGFGGPRAGLGARPWGAGTAPRGRGLSVGHAGRAGDAHAAAPAGSYSLRGRAS